MVIVEIPAIKPISIGILVCYHVVAGEYVILDDGRYLLKIGITPGLLGEDIGDWVRRQDFSGSLPDWV